jgi:transposase
MRKPLVSEDLWRRVEPLLPKPRRSRHRQHAGRRRADDRATFEGIVFVVKTGIPWAALPATEPWPSGVTCWRRLRQWHRAGVWRRLLTNLLAELRARDRLDLRRALVDASFVRAPRGGAATGPSPVDRRKRGSKHHLLTDAEGTPLAITLTAANRNEITQLLALVEAIPPLRGKPGPPARRPAALQGDRGYDSEPHRRALKKSASARSLHAAAHHTAAVSARPAGPSSEACPGSISSGKSGAVRSGASRRIAR